MQQLLAPNTTQHDHHMPITPFKLERYFAKHEFSTRYLLSASDCESLTMAELLRMATPESRELWDALNLGYTESPGHSLLRAEVAKLHERIAPDQVLIAVPCSIHITPVIHFGI